MTRIVAISALVGLLCTAAAVLASPPIAGIYVDSEGINWSQELIVDVTRTAYTHVFASFYLPSLKETTDFAYVVLNPNPAYGGTYFINQTHLAGKKVILVVGGATELPISPSYFSDNDPVQLANTLAKLVRTFGIDGVNFDYEDDYSNANPGLTGYGPTRAPGTGPAVAWLVTLTKTLRQLLPREQGYTISHAPQAPYFKLGYDQVYKQTIDPTDGPMIDFFTIQFYNQGVNEYITYEDLVISDPEWNGSITEIVNEFGIPAEKVVVGKIVAPGDGNNGYLDPATFASYLHQALGPFPTLGGFMGWQWGSDTSGAWAATLAGAFSEARANATSVY